MLIAEILIFTMVLTALTVLARKNPTFALACLAVTSVVSAIVGGSSCTLAAINSPPVNAWLAHALCPMTYRLLVYVLVFHLATAGSVLRFLVTNPPKTLIAR